MKGAEHRRRSFVDVIGAARRGIVPLARLGRDKLTGLRRQAPLYAPSRQPVGRELTVVSAVDVGSPSDVSVHESVPARRVRTGADSWVDAPPIYAVSVAEAQLVTDVRAFAAFITSRGQIVAEISEDYRGPKGDFRSVRRLQRLPDDIRLGRCVSLLTGGGGLPNYFHWLYDVVPRVHVLEEAGAFADEAAVLVPEMRYAFQHETLEILGIARERCVELARPTTVFADEMVVTTGHRNHRYVEPWIAGFLRDRFVTRSDPGRRRLYINRRDADLRRTIGEPALESALAELGVTSVSLSGLPVAEQAELFASAELIVAPHGAGLANLVFCRPGTRVIELVGEGVSWPVYAHLADDIGLRYRAVEALEAVVPRAMPARLRERLGRRFDARVDIERVVAATEEALAAG